MSREFRKFLAKYEYHNGNLALLLIRLGLALVFFAHGWPKWQNIEQVTGFFASLGLGTFFVYLVAVVEVAGAASMLIGGLARWAGLALSVDMFFAIYLAKWPRGGLAGSELELLLLLMALAIYFAGPGAYTLVRLLGKKQE